MDILHENILNLILLGIIDSTAKSFYLKISKCVCLISPILLLLPLIAYFIVNFRSVDEATSAFYLICITGMGFLTYVDCLRKRSTIILILEHLQYFVDHSEAEFLKFYVSCDLLTNKIVQYFRVFVFACVYIVVTIPLLILIVQLVRGNYSTELRILPASLL